ncbi:MAG: CRISPR-associated ring nuclease Crn3/Csx3 [Candidatus Bathyarchaeia archaeon]
MQNIKFKVEEKTEYSIVEFELENNITPDILSSLKPPNVNGQKGVILSGRGPIWLYCYLTHFYHPTRFIAVFDPRLGAVVVQSHHPEKKVGEIIK